MQAQTPEEIQRFIRLQIPIYVGTEEKFRDKSIEYNASLCEKAREILSRNAHLYTDIKKSCVEYAKELVVQAEDALQQQ